MTGFLARIFSARNGDFEDGGWMQLLVFVLIAVIYALGSLAKTKAEKAGKKKEGAPGPEPAGKRRYKPLKDFGRPEEAERPVAVGTRRVSRKAQRDMRQRPKSVEPPQVVPQRYIKTKRIGPKPLSVLPSVKPGAVGLPEVPELAKIEKLRITAPAGLKEKPSEQQAEVTRIEGVLDYEDPDALRSAIVHYEIFGRPLSLREPSDHIWES